MTLLVYKDTMGNYELWDDREADHDFVSGTEDLVFDEWGKRNRALLEDGFLRDNMMGLNEWQQFIS